eukprot:COSAG02_NODE_5581_length_4215_cov_1.971817_4_plen_49_part_00
MEVSPSHWITPLVTVSREYLSRSMWIVGDSITIRYSQSLQSIPEDGHD